MYSLILNGKRSIIELQKKWRYLSVSVKLVNNAFSLSNSFSSSTAADARPKPTLKGQKFTVSYLVGSLGLSTKLAESISRKVSFEVKGNPDSVLNLLRSHGFTDSQISSIITGYPRLLVSDAEKTLGPKLRFLKSKGASTSELTEIVSTVPKILGVKGDKTISRYYDCVKEIIESDKSSKFEMVGQSLAKGSRQENKIRNVLVLRRLGVPRRLLFSLLISSFGTLCGKEVFEESLKKVVEMGFDPTTSKFVEAINVFYQMSDSTLEKKVDVYKRLGFAEGDVWEIFKKWPIFMALSEKNILNSNETFLRLGFSRDEFVMMVKWHPRCIGLSVEAVKNKTEFLVKKMNWPLKSVALFPQVLGLSMEKRIVPRCNVIKALMSKGLLGSKLPPIRSALKSTDHTFLNKYVMKHGELVPELMAIFTVKEEKNR